MHYKAFISYSHAADGKLAPALQSGLHKFARPWYRLRAIRVFRDDTNLSISPGLWASIEKALANSEYFLLLASPQAALSKWVRQEVNFWLNNRPSQNLLIALTDGDISWDSENQNFDWNQTTALPKNLDHAFNEEPLFLDMKAAKTAEDLSLKNPIFLDKIADLGATLHGRNKDELIGEDVRQHQKIKRLSWSAGIALVLLTLASIAAAAYAVWQQQIAERKAVEAQSLALSANAQQAMGSNDTDLAISLAVQANKIENPPLQVKKVLRQVAFLSPGTRMVFKGHKSKVNSVAISPDGRYGLSGSDDHTIRLWDLKARKEVRSLLGHFAAVTSVAFSPDGRLALSGSKDRSIRLWDVASGKEVESFLEHTGEVTSVAFGPKGRLAASGSSDKTLMLWDLSSRKFKRFSGHDDAILSVAISPDGAKALSGAKDDRVCLWDIATGEKIRCQKYQSWYVFSVTFSPDGRTALSGAGGWDCGVLLWDIERGGIPEKCFDRYEGGHWSVAFSPKGYTALSGSNNNSIILYEGDKRKGKNHGSILQVFLGHTGPVTSVAFGPDGRSFLSGSADQTVRLWDIAGGAEVRKWQGILPAAMTSSPTGKSALVISNTQYPIRALDIQSGKEVQSYRLDLGGIELTSITSSPNGRNCLVGAKDGRIRLLDLEDGGLMPLNGFGHRGTVNDIAISLDGRSAISGSYGSRNPAIQNDGKGVLILWDVERKQAKKHLIGHTSVVRSVAISSDGLTGLSGSADGTAILWDLSQGKQISQLRNHTDEVHDVVFSPDQKSILTASLDGSLKLWDIDSGEVTRTFNGHSGGVNTVAISPDGKTIVSGGEDDSIRLWNIETGAEIATFWGHSNDVTDIVFLPDGSHFLSLSWDGTIRLWQMAMPENLIKWTYLNRHVENFTCDERQRYRIEPLC